MVLGWGGGKPAGGGESMQPGEGKWGVSSGELGVGEQRMWSPRRRVMSQMGDRRTWHRDSTGPGESLLQRVDRAARIKVLPLVVWQRPA